MARSRSNHQPIELPQEVFGLSANFEDSFSFSAAHSALHGVLIDSPKDLFSRWLKVHAVQEVFSAGTESQLPRRVPKVLLHGTNLDVSPLLVDSHGMQMGHQILEFFISIAEGLAIVGKWQRDDAVAGDPTADATESHPVL